MSRARWGDVVGAAAGFVVALVVAVAWVPFRSGQPNVEVGLLLVAVVTAVGVSGRRAAVVAAALGAAVSFTYFDTEPYDHFVISRQPDVATAVSLIVVGLITGELAVRVARQRRNDQSATGDLGRVREAASLLAAGEELVVMIGAVAHNVQRQLQLSDCWFVAEPIPEGTPTVERDGSLHSAPACRPEAAAPEAAHPEIAHPEIARLGVARLEAPKPSPGQASPVPARAGPASPAPASDQVEMALPVWALGQVVGHFVLQAGPTATLERERLRVAVTLADQVGASLAAQAPMPPPPPEQTPVPNLRVIH
jgi:hypothetical protein